MNIKTIVLLYLLNTVKCTSTADLILNNEKCYSLTVVFNRIMTSVLHALLKMMLCMLKLMKHRIIFSLFWYWSPVTGLR